MLTSTAALEVLLILPLLGIYIEKEARQATYILNCSGEFTRARFGHSEVFEKMTNEWPFLPRSSWLSQETSEILPSDGVIIYTDDSLCEGRAGAGVFSDTLDIRESQALGSFDMVFQTEVYRIFAYSDYCRSA
jgi:hypothetical protein